MAREAIKPEDYTFAGLAICSDGKVRVYDIDTGATTEYETPEAAYIDTITNLCRTVLRLREKLALV